MLIQHKCKWKFLLLFGSSQIENFITAKSTRAALVPFKTVEAEFFLIKRELTERWQCSTMHRWAKNAFYCRAGGQQRSEKLTRGAARWEEKCELAGCEWAAAVSSFVRSPLPFFMTLPSKRSTLCRCEEIGFICRRGDRCAQQNTSNRRATPPHTKSSSALPPP